jgi:hypothetical protein
MITDNAGLKMRIVALDELMKCCMEIGRSSESAEYKAFAKTLYQVAKTRHDFLSASRSDTETDQGNV